MISVAFDTSVLVAGVMAKHVHHARALVWVEAARNGRIGGVICSHALAELYSVLTKYPVSPRVTPEEAEQLARACASAFRVVNVSKELALGATARCAERGFVSGAIYDALHVVTAEESSADIMLTFNVSDFVRLATATGPRVVEPPDPPGLVLPGAAGGTTAAQG